MPNPTVPTPQDAALLMQDTTTRTGNYTTPAVDLGSGFAPGGLGKPVAAIVHVTALDTTDGNELYTMFLQESNDNVTFTAAGASTVPVVGVVPVRGWATKRYVRLSVTIAGTSPSMTFKAWLNPLT